MYLRNAWYVTAWDHEITRDPLPRTLLNQPVVLYRTAAGTPVALHDRCCHRRAPLSAGRVVGDRIRCGYHGLMFEPNGTCAEVPSQTTVPPGARVRSYPAIERHRWVWVWMGEPDAADPDLIPDAFWHGSPDWMAIGDRFHVKCHYQALVEIQLDNTHSRFVHPTSLGNAGALRTTPKVTRADTTIHTARRMRDSDPPPLLARAAGITGNADVWVTWTYRPQSGAITFDTGIAEVNSGVFDGDQSKAYNVYNTHGITPETDTTCHHFWVSARDFSLEDEEVTTTMRSIRETFLEDVAMVESQQRCVDIDPDAPTVDISADQPTIQARRLVARLIDMENG